MSAERQPGPQGRGESLASSTADQVRAIIEAAENSAAEIQRQATAPLKAMLERLDEVRAELSALIEGLPEAGNAEPAQPVPEPVPPPVPEPVPPPMPEPVPPPEPEPVPPPQPAPPQPAPDSEPEAEGARLIALNMALNGSSREETERYLSENFSSLSDRAGLLDDVYSSVQG